MQLTADDGAGTVAGPVPVPVSRVTVDVPTRSKPRKRVNFRVFGFEANKKVYLHIRRNGQTKGRFSLGRTDSPCGHVVKKMRFMPLSNYRTGTYRLLLLALQEVLQEGRHLRRQGDDLPHASAHCRPLRRRQPAPGAEAPPPARGGFA